MIDLKSQLEKSIKLAHLELESEEKETLLSDLEKILHFVEIIDKAEKEGDKLFNGKMDEFEREFPQLKKSNTMRQDIIRDFDNNAGLMKEVPSKKDNLIKVKRI